VDENSLQKRRRIGGIGRVGGRAGVGERDIREGKRVLREGSGGETYGGEGG
jgi:hypothetical protein